MNIVIDSRVSPNAHLTVTSAAGHLTGFCSDFATDLCPSQRHMNKPLDFIGDVFCIKTTELYITKEEMSNNNRGIY